MPTPRLQGTFVNPSVITTPQDPSTFSSLAGVLSGAIEVGAGIYKQKQEEEKIASQKAEMQSFNKQLSDINQNLETGRIDQTKAVMLAQKTLDEALIRNPEMAQFYTTSFSTITGRQTTYGGFDQLNQEEQDRKAQKDAIEANRLEDMQKFYIDPNAPDANLQLNRQRKLEQERVRKQTNVEIMKASNSLTKNEVLATTWSVASEETVKFSNLTQLTLAQMENVPEGLTKEEHKLNMIKRINEQHTQALSLINSSGEKFLSRDEMENMMSTINAQKEQALSVLNGGLELDVYVNRQKILDSSAHLLKYNNDPQIKATQDLVKEMTSNESRLFDLMLNHSGIKESDLTEKFAESYFRLTGGAKFDAAFATQQERQQFTTALFDTLSSYDSEFSDGGEWEATIKQLTGVSEAMKDPLGKLTLIENDAFTKFLASPAYKKLQEEKPEGMQAFNDNVAEVMNISNRNLIQLANKPEMLGFNEHIGNTIVPFVTKDGKVDVKPTPHYMSVERDRAELLMRKWRQQVGTRLNKQAQAYAQVTGQSLKEAKEFIAELVVGKPSSPTTPSAPAPVPSSEEAAELVREQLKLQNYSDEDIEKLLEGVQ